MSHCFSLAAFNNNHNNIISNLLYYQMHLHFPILSDCIIHVCCVRACAGQTVFPKLCCLLANATTHSWHQVKHLQGNKSITLRGGRWRSHCHTLLLIVAHLSLIQENNASIRFIMLFVWLKTLFFQFSPRRSGGSWQSSQLPWSDWGRYGRLHRFVG